MPILPALALLALALLTACADDAPLERANRVVLRDSAGVAVIESAAPAWAEGEGWTVDAEPLLDLAKSGEGPDHEFFRATDANRLSDGGVVVADDGDDEIRVFSPEGDHLRTLGRPGDGPGEFRRLRQVMALPGDSILAYDYWQSRATLFAPDGSVARVVTMEEAYRPRPLYPVASGGYVGESSDFTGFGDELGLHRMPSPVVRFADDGAVVDTLSTLAGYESVVFSRGDAVALWGKEGHLHVRGDTVYLGTADSLAYEVRSEDGRLLRRVRVPGYDLTLSAEEIEAERQTLVPDDPSQLDAIGREILDRQPVRTHRPGYQRMVVDALGYVWLGAYQGRHERDEPRDWRVFAPDGEWLGVVTLPPRFRVFRIGPEWILGRRADELDIQHIQLLRLSRESMPPSPTGAAR